MAVIKGQRTQYDLLAELIEREVRQSHRFVLNVAGQVEAEDFERLENAVNGTDLLIAIGDYDALLMRDLVERCPEAIISFITIVTLTVSAPMVMKE
ncbi:MAG: hypothetical protein EOP21_13275, partial [Hyphomicrobiales bacterium]